MLVQDKVIGIIASQALLGTEDIELNQSIESLGIDSMGMVEIIFAIEESFDISIPFNANTAQQNETTLAFDISTVASVISGVEKLYQEQKG